MKKVLVYGLKLGSFLIFVLASLIALVMANGYFFDFSTRDFRKTGIIDVSAYSVENANVYLDQKLVAEVFPLQIKGILKGNYALSIVKPGFVPWKRKLAVSDEVVTRIGQVLLFPLQLDTFLKSTTNFEDNWDKKFPFLRGVALYDSKKSILKFVLFNSDKVSFSPITTLPEKNLQKVQVIDTKVIVEFASGKRYSNNIQGGIWEEVFPLQAFVFAGNQWFYGNENLLFSTYEKGVIKQIFYENKANIQAMRFVEGYRDGALIIKANNGKRFLNTFQNGRLVELTRNLSGDPILAPQGIIFTDIFGNVFMYQDEIGKVLMKRFQDPPQLIQWFDRYDYFLYHHQGQIFLTDVSFDNVIPVLASDEVDQIAVTGEAMYVLKDLTLQLFQWVE